MTDSDLNRRKRIVFRACHRGIKEMDIVVGTYVKQHIDTADEAELAEFERILEISDQVLLSWLNGVEPLPEDMRSETLEKMLASRFDETFFGNSQS